MSTDVLVDYQGNVSWLAAAIFRSSCMMDVQFYPFDEQVYSYYRVIIIILHDGRPILSF
jgi:uncharacterized protein YegL